MKKILNFNDFINRLLEISEKIYDRYNDEFGEFNKYFNKYKNRQGGMISVGYVDNVNIYKNPKNLDNFENNVRAILDKRGDLYVAQEDGDFIHGDIAKSLGMTNNKYGIYDKKDSVVLLNRVGNKNSFALSDTFINFYEDNKNSIDTILTNGKKTNPQYDFISDAFYNLIS